MSHFLIHLIVLAAAFYRGDSARSGIYDTKFRLDTNVEQTLEVEADASRSCVVGYGDYLLYPTRSGFCRVKKDDEETLDCLELSGTIIKVPPAVDADLECAFVATDRGLLCIDLSKAQLELKEGFKIQSDPSCGRYSTPAMDEAFVYLVSQAGAVYKINKTTGKIVEYEIVGPPRSCVTVKNGRLFVAKGGADCDSIHCLSCKDLSEMWSEILGCGEEVTGAIAADDYCVYVSASNHLYRFDQESEKLLPLVKKGERKYLHLWKLNFEGPLSSPAVAYWQIFFVESEEEGDTLYAMSPQLVRDENGRYQPKFYGVTSLNHSAHVPNPIVAGRHVLLSCDGVVKAFDMDCFMYHVGEIATTDPFEGDVWVENGYLACICENKLCGWKLPKSR